jgi:hypothetical protein
MLLSLKIITFISSDPNNKIIFYYLVLVTNYVIHLDYVIYSLVYTILRAINLTSSLQLRQSFKLKIKNGLVSFLATKAFGFHR